MGFWFKFSLSEVGEDKLNLFRGNPVDDLIQLFHHLSLNMIFSIVISIDFNLHSLALKK